MFKGLISYTTNMPNSDKFVIDGLSIATTTAAVFNFLPAIATVFTIIWTVIRIYETATVQKLLRRNKNVGKD